MKEIWVKDTKGNCCSVEYFGSRKAAQKALDSLRDCKDCTNCTRCSGCSGCYGCYGCSRCSDCSDCFDCFDCTRCSGCSGCSACSRCIDCTRCTDCYRCSDCSACFDCTDKFGEGAANEPIVVPVIPAIHRSVYEAASQPDALEMGTWHTCKNTHCRAGWAVTLAGPDGKKLEEQFGTCLAAMMIYDASDPNYKINPCRFFDTNKQALKDMKRLAAGKP